MTAEGSVIAYHGHQIYAAAQWYERSGDPEGLDLAARLARFCMMPRFWGGVADPEGERMGLIGYVASGLPDPANTPGAKQGH